MHVFVCWKSSRMGNEKCNNRNWGLSCTNMLENRGILNLEALLFWAVLTVKWQAAESNFNKQPVVLAPCEQREKYQEAFSFSDSFKIQILRQALCPGMHRCNCHPSQSAAQKSRGTEQEAAVLAPAPPQTHCRDTARCEAEVSSSSSALQVLCHS